MDQMTSKYFDTLWILPSDTERMDKVKAAIEIYEEGIANKDTV